VVVTTGREPDGVRRALGLRNSPGIVPPFHMSYGRLIPARGGLPASSAHIWRRSRIPDAEPAIDRMASPWGDALIYGVRGGSCSSSSCRGCFSVAAAVCVSFPPTTATAAAAAWSPLHAHGACKGEGQPQARTGRNDNHRGPHQGEASVEPKLDGSERNVVEREVRAKKELRSNQPAAVWLVNPCVCYLTYLGHEAHTVQQFRLEAASAAAVPATPRIFFERVRRWPVEGDGMGGSEGSLELEHHRASWHRGRGPGRMAPR